jgi:hypothetical protein
MFGGRPSSVLRSPSAYAEALAEALGIAFAKLQRRAVGKLCSAEASRKRCLWRPMGAKLAEGKCLGHFSVSFISHSEIRSA